MLNQRVSTWRDGITPLVARLNSLGLLSEYALIGGLVLVGLIAHGVNLFGYPSYTIIEDEGTYVADAWALLTQGKLSPYAYNYGATPGGWILLAFWMLITGGPRTFGEVINSGRVLILLLDLASIPLLYHIVRRLGGGVAVAAFATFLFAISPLAVTFQRLVLLDNFMMFWMLASVSLVLHSRGRLSFFALSGLCFGLAMLSKLTALYMIPAMLYLVWRWRQPHHGKFSFFAWLVPMGVATSWFPVYALIKGELLPSQFTIHLFGRTFVYNSGPHTSLLDAVVYQTNRPGGSVFDPTSQFWFNMNTLWVPLDHVLIIGGAIATAVNLIRGIFDKRASAAAILSLFSILFLARGSVVFQHYILLAIPFLAINIGLLAAPIVNRLPAALAAVVAVAAMGWLVYTYQQTNSFGPIFTQQANVAVVDAETWMKANVPADAKIVGRDPFWPDMHAPGLGGPEFVNYHSHWEVGADPAIRDGVFHNQWQQVDYVMITPDMPQMLQDSSNDLVLKALNNSTLVKRWSANGTTVELWKVDKSGKSEGVWASQEGYVISSGPGKPSTSSEVRGASSGSEAYPQQTAPTPVATPTK